jgi:hypothetical protein
MHDVDHADGCSIDVLFMGDDIDRAVYGDFFQQLHSMLRARGDNPASDYQVGIALSVPVK